MSIRGSAIVVSAPLSSTKIRPASSSRGRNKPRSDGFFDTRTAPPIVRTRLSATSSMPTVGPTTRSPLISSSSCNGARSSDAPVRMTRPVAARQPASAGTVVLRLEHDDPALLAAVALAVAKQEATRQTRADRSALIA